MTDDWWAHKRIFEHWRGRGLSTRASNILAIASLETDEEVKALGPKVLARHVNCGPVTVAEIFQVLFWRDSWPDSQLESAKMFVRRCLADQNPDEATVERVARKVVRALPRIPE